MMVDDIAGIAAREYAKQQHMGHLHDGHPLIQAFTAAIAEGRRQMREEAAALVNAIRDEDSPDLDFRSIRDRISAIPIGVE